MGALKNQIVADQVELGDRIAAPKPAQTHVAFPSRRLHRNAMKRHQKKMRAMTRELIITAVVYVTIGAMLGAFITYVVVTF